ncbi:MAG: pilus assembly protein N-terminal domain-containing protein [Candidatus Omnitrophica bacterium]|nr:pilus assembly protein N-terminal domain-containing protein [Candidatus Omnitrophota bacterium]
MKKVFIILLVVIFSNSFILPAYPYTRIPEYLCELGLKFYNEGNYEQALYEFKKALIARPDYEPAMKYILMIQQEKTAREKMEELLFIPDQPTDIPAKEVFKEGIKVQPAPRKSATVSGSIREQLELLDLRNEMIAQKQAYFVLASVGMPKRKEIIPPKVIILDEFFKDMPQPMEIEQGKSIVIAGKNIQRFLLTQPSILLVERKGPDELLITGKDIGYTYLHVWDDRERWTLEFFTTPPRPVGLTLEEEMRLAEERAENFKLRYTMDWTSYETGRRIYSLKKSYSGWAHLLSLNGFTPYGDLDVSTNIRRIKTSTDLTYFTLGLTNGLIGPFKGFKLRGFDYSIPFSNLAIPSIDLRGVTLTSPVSNKKIEYDVFWGKEGGGRYGNLSPGLSKSIDSLMTGFNINYLPTEKQIYRFSLAHGWGRDRDPNLNSYGYDFDTGYNFDKWGINYEIAQDSQTFAHLLTTNYHVPNFRLTTELRDIDKNFRSIIGQGSRAGELGLLSTFYYTPSTVLSMSGRLNAYRDRLYPSLDNDARWNEDFNYEANYTLDELTSLRFDYVLQNDLGKVGQSRYQSPGLGLSRTFELIKKVYTFANYRHQENKNFSSPGLDYLNDKIRLGLRFNLINELYYYLNKEFNWLEERFSGNRSQPNAMEMGLDWSKQILESPFYGSLRFSYRDEEDTNSPLSFLSGEDYIECYTSLIYRPTPEIEAYCYSRIRNIWADNPNVNKRVEADFNAGLRYLWNTGFRWESEGAIEGYVFKDFNGDGLRQRDEPPVEGVKIWLGKDKSQVTDMFGYYKFSKVKAKKAYVNIDVVTIPSGFLLTGPAIQEAAIAHRQTIGVNFGIISRSEITGIVFEDSDRNVQFGPKDLGIRGAVLLLEDGTKTTTDPSGRYYFRNIGVGKHTVTLDLNSLPYNYLPEVPVFKDIELFEGISYNYNIPIRNIEE